MARIEVTSGSVSEEKCKSGFSLTDLRRQLSDGVFRSFQYGELGEQGQVVGELSDPCPLDVPLLQVGHPLQLPGKVLQEGFLKHTNILEKDSFKTCHSPPNALPPAGGSVSSDLDLSRPAAGLLTGTQTQHAHQTPRESMRI